MSSRRALVRARQRRRRKLAMAVALLLVGVGVGVGLLLFDGRHASAHRSAAAIRPVGRARPHHPTSCTQRCHRQPPPKPMVLGVGVRVMRIVDPTRRIRLPSGRYVPRVLLTIVRYPARVPNGAEGVNAAPIHLAGPLPLVVFGHGFTQTPTPYAQLLRYWARAGFVVAAPVFPLENANAPGGPNESDLANQPADVSLVISFLERSSLESGPLHGLLDPTRIAVAGHSDGGETALAVAYDAAFRDPRITAAVVLSGAQLPGGRLQFPVPSPPLLAVQGTADTINLPWHTEQFFAAAPDPKYLLRLTGASHLTPYTTAQPQLGVVERVSRAFLERYVAGAPITPHQLSRLGDVPGVATLQAQP